MAQNVVNDFFSGLNKPPQPVTKTGTSNVVNTFFSNIKPVVAPSPVKTVQPKSSPTLIQKVSNFINPPVVSPLQEPVKQKSIFEQISDAITKKLTSIKLSPGTKATLKSIGENIQADIVPEGKKIVPAAKQYTKDTLNSALNVVKDLGKFTPAYLLYKQVQGKPVTPKEYVDNLKKLPSTALEAMGVAWRVNPTAPLVGAGLNSWAGVRQFLQGKIGPKELAKAPVEGINKQPGIGAVLTDNVNIATAIDVVFLASMFAKPFANKKIGELNLKSEELNSMSKTLGVKPNATMEEVSNAFKNKIKQIPDTFTSTPNPENALLRTELTNAYNTLKKAGFIEKKYAQAYEFLQSKLGKSGVTTEPVPTSPKQLGEGAKPLETKGLDKVTEKKIQDLNTQDAKNPVAEGNIRVYQAVSPGNKTDYVFKSPEELASYKNNVTAPEEQFKYIDVPEEQVKPVGGKPGVFKLESQVAQPPLSDVPTQASKGVEVKPKTVSVPRDQLPVGEGVEKVSKLEARIKDVLDKTPTDVIEKMGLTNYQQMIKKENISSAVEYVTKSPDDALAVLRGDKEAPKGILRNSIYVAMQNQAIGDVDLARKLASLSSTRYGQEISILTEIDPNSPVKAMSDIVKIREEVFKKRYKGQKVSDVKKKVAQDIKSKIRVPDKTDWNSFIKSIEC